VKIRIRLIHWNKIEGVERAKELKGEGYEVEFSWFSSAKSFNSSLKGLRDHPPDAVVIDMSRLPSAGRDVAMAIRSYKTIRALPLVFVQGEPEKVERFKTQLPSAVFARWGQISRAIRTAIANPPVEPIKSTNRLEGYSGTPLPKKLGIRPGFVIALLGAPKDFEKTLGRLPERVALLKHTNVQPNLTIWFPRSRLELERDVEELVPLAEQAGLWIAWPKRSSGVPTDLSETVVRKTGLRAGLVDFKIASIDTTWSGLRFTKRG
jgi:hypothetical protein